MDHSQHEERRAHRSHRSRGCLLAILLSMVPAHADQGKVGLANPASVFCGERGGTVVIETAADGGQTGICVFPNGTRVNEWAYFRSNHRTTH